MKNKLKYNMGGIVEEVRKKGYIVKIKNKGLENQHIDMISPNDVIWGDNLSLIEESKDKCLVGFPIPQYGKDSLDGDLGFIAVLMKNKIMFDDLYTTDDELVFEFDKKHTKKIKDTERKYFKHGIQIDAKNMSDFTMYVINSLGVGDWRKKNIRKKSRKVK